MKKINVSTKTYPNKFTFVDDKDYKYLSQWKWYAYKNKNTFYVYHIHKDNKTQKHKNILIHRILIKCPKNMIVDHRNHNGLDNRKCNLRICTNSENLRNSKTRKGTSKYKGVSFNKRDKKWQVFIGYKNKHKNLGVFFNEIEAAKAYNCAAKILHGEFAYLNKI